MERAALLNKINSGFTPGLIYPNQEGAAGVWIHSKRRVMREPISVPS